MAKDVAETVKAIEVREKRNDAELLATYRAESHDVSGPANFVPLSRVDRIGFDTETNGTEFSSRPVGMSISLPDGTDHYYRWGHEMGGNNCTKAQAMRWAGREMNRSDLTIFMHNAGFDMRMTAYENGNENLFPLARVEDTGFMAALMNEERIDLSLDGLGTEELGMPKEDDGLWEFCAEMFGGQPTRKSQAKNIWRAPGDLVNTYACTDSRITLSLGDHFTPMLAEEGLTEIYDMEIALIPILLKMHMVGVRVDVDKAVALKERLQKELAKAERKFFKEYGDVNYRSTKQLVPLFEKFKLPYKMTEAGNPSITKEDLAALDHPMGVAITRMKRLGHFAGTFIDNYILKNADDHGIIHGEFHPLRNDKYGARSGRFSSGGGLNLQNVPARDEEWAPLIRGLYIPMDPRRQLWEKADYSQIEFRFLAHYAGGDIMDQYNQNPDIDFHQMCAELVGIPRRPAKNINFGIIYGMGKAKMARELGVSMSESEELLSEYHDRLPAVKKLYNRCDRRANQRGYIVTWGGRKRRFKARGRHFQNTHKALNALLQGSAADLMKKAILAVCSDLDWELTPLHLTVHDELDFSVPKEKRARKRFNKQLRERMEDFDLRVPVKVDIEYGPDWGHAKEAA